LDGSEKEGSNLKPQTIIAAGIGAAVVLGTGAWFLVRWIRRPRISIPPAPWDFSLEQLYQGVSDEFLAGV